MLIFVILKSSFDMTALYNYNGSFLDWKLVLKYLEKSVGYFLSTSII